MWPDSPVHDTWPTIRGFCVPASHLNQVPRHSRSSRPAPLPSPLPGHCPHLSPPQPFRHRGPLFSPQHEAPPAPWLSGPRGSSFSSSLLSPRECCLLGAVSRCLLAPVPCVQWPLSQDCWMDMKVPHTCRGTANCSWFHASPPHWSQPRGHPSGRAPPARPAGRPLPLPRGVPDPAGPRRTPSKSAVRRGCQSPWQGATVTPRYTSGKLEDICDPGAGRPLSPLDPTSPPVTEMTTHFPMPRGWGAASPEATGCWAPSRGACTNPAQVSALARAQCTSSPQRHRALSSSLCGRQAAVAWPGAPRSPGTHDLGSTKGRVVSPRAKKFLLSVGGDGIRGERCPVPAESHMHTEPEKGTLRGDEGFCGHRQVRRRPS